MSTTSKFSFSLRGTTREPPRLLQCSSAYLEVWNHNHPHNHHHFLHIGSEFREHVELSCWEILAKVGKGESQLLRIVQRPWKSAQLQDNKSFLLDFNLQNWKVIRSTMELQRGWKECFLTSCSHSRPNSEDRYHKPLKSFPMMRLKVGSQRRLTAHLSNFESQ